jgi:hypothetical protein
VGHRRGVALTGDGSVNRMVRVGRFGSRGEAEVARGMLSEHGIEARVVVDDVAGMHPELSLATGGASLAVAEDDAEEARELLGDVPDELAGPSSGRPRRLLAALLLAVAVLLAVAMILAIADVGLHWL